jgi:SnoaL-like polyketide cyclase
MTPDRHQLLDFARHYARAWCSQDPGSVARHYAEEGSLTINGGPPSVGRAAITDAAKSFMTAFPDLQVLMDDLVVRDHGAEWSRGLEPSGHGLVGSDGTCRRQAPAGAYTAKRPAITSWRPTSKG